LSGWEFSLQSALLGALWIPFVVGSANFFNFMDGIDGIAGISGAVGFGLLALFGFSQSFFPHAFFCLLVVAACLGFLPFNLPRARVFMGDAGSIPLGFVFGALVFSMTGGPADFLCLISFLYPFYADSISTLFIRWRRGERISQPHRRHLYQLLANELNNTHASVSLGYGGLQLSVGLIMFFLRRSGLIWQLIFLLLLTCGFLLATYRVRRSPRVCNLREAR
jgi:Fuc2NAc and GlcNAc transferase